MKAREAVELARQWVETEGCKTPGFQGAHLMGSLVTMPSDAPFATYRDVDLSIVVPDGCGYQSGKWNQELLYKGLILEVAFHEVHVYSSPEAVLSNPGLAPCFAAGAILSDPTGMLESLHQRAAEEFAHRKWVKARCEYEKERFGDRLEGIRQAESPAEVALNLLHALVYVAGIVAVAHLRQPTHRRCLILMRELLEPHHRLDLCEEALDVMGCAHMTRPQVETYLEETARAFGRALAVYHTPFPDGAFKMHPHVRPYVVEATQEMIDEGHHREAMGWIYYFLRAANTVIQNDAPEDEKARYQAAFDRLLEDMGLSTPEDWAARAGQARSLAANVFQVADEIVAQNPEIVD